jgi:2-oxoglutarate dehydrogenase E1 component
MGDTYFVFDVSKRLHLLVLCIHSSVRCLFDCCDLPYFLKIRSSSGDVKYHLGTAMSRSYPDGRKVNISLHPNPSHLEAVDPVVIGAIRAKQFYMGNKEETKRKCMPVLLHGDAAFAGQGIVYETIQMSRVPDYAVGGTIHIIINNQVPYTVDV